MLFRPPEEATQQASAERLSVSFPYRNNSFMQRRAPKLSLLIADNHPVFLHGLESIFRLYPDIEVVAQCQNGSAAMEAIRALVPDVAMLEISLPGMSGLDILNKVNAEAIPTRILFLAAGASVATIRSAISAGAKGVLPKEAAPDDIARSIRRTAAGKYASPKDLVKSVRKHKLKINATLRRPLRQLTPRELDVARLVVNGLSNKEIGRRMQLSEGTVKIHLHNIYKKLGVANRTALATMIVTR